MELTEKQKKILWMAADQGITKQQARKVFSSENHIMDVLKHLAEQGFMKPDYGVWRLTEKGRDYLREPEGEQQQIRTDKTWTVINNLQDRIRQLEKQVEMLLKQRSKE